MTVHLLPVACLTVLLSNPPTSAVQPIANSAQRVVRVGEIAAFLRTLPQRRPHEFGEVLRDAQQRFPRGAVLERFPESVSAHLPKQGPTPLMLVKFQVEKDGLDANDVKAVTLFKGDNGRLQVDIIVVLMRDTNVVAGVYSAFWGR